MPERILRHLEAIERVMKTASYTIECLKKLAGLCLILACLVTVVRVGNASSDSYRATARKTDQEIADALKIASERQDLVRLESERTQALLVELLEELRGRR